MKDYLLNHVHFCHNLDQVEWNDRTARSTNTVYCCCKKKLKNGRANDTKLVIWHIISLIVFLFLHVCIWLSRVYVLQHRCILTGAVLVMQSDSYSYFVAMGLSWGGLGSKFIWCHWSKCSPWHVHETSTRWQMCCTGTETEINGCQLALADGCFKLHVCAVCHISLILFFALCSGLLFVTVILYHHMLNVSFVFPAAS